MAEMTAKEMAAELLVATERVHGSVCWPGTDAIEAVIVHVVDRCACVVETTPTIRGRVIQKPREIAAVIRRSFFPATDPGADEEK